MSMKTKKRYLGYLRVEHALTLPGAPRLFEADTYTCSHCHYVVVLNHLRTRDRAYCPKCDHYVCDACGAIRAMDGGQCKTFNQIIEETQEQAALNEQRGIIAVP